MKSREAKVTVRSNLDPELFHWVSTLKYGCFPKIVLDILRWYEKHGLLIKGGVNHPDILPPQIPLNQQQQESIQTDQTLEQLDRVVEIALVNNKLLRSGEIFREILKEEQLEKIEQILDSSKNLQDKINVLTQDQLQLQMIIQAQSQIIAQLQGQAILSQPQVQVGNRQADQSSTTVENHTAVTDGYKNSMDGDKQTVVTDSMPKAESPDLQNKPIEEDLSDVPKMGSPFKVFRKQN